MRIVRRPKKLEVVFALFVSLLGVYFYERRFPSFRERRKLAQIVEANFNDIELQRALQSLIDQTDGSVTMTVCSDLLRIRVSLKSRKSVPLGDALKEIAGQIPTKYYPYGMLDVAVAHPVFLCRDHNETATTISKTSNNH